MSMLLLFLLTYAIPVVGCLVLGGLTYLGQWSLGWALGWGTVAVGLRGGSNRWHLATWIRAGGTTLVLEVLGASLTHFLVVGWGAFGVVLSSMVLALGVAWFVVSVWLPTRLAAVRFPRFPFHRTRATLFVLGVCCLPFLTRAEQRTSAELVQDELRARGLFIRGHAASVDEPYKGLAALFNESRHVFVAARKGDLDDVYLARVRYDFSGTPAKLTGVYNLSQTALVAEDEPKLYARWLAWTVAGSEGISHIEVADLSGEAPGTGTGWGIRGQIQRALTNWQQMGQRSGIGFTQISVSKDVRVEGIELEQGTLLVHQGNGDTWRWTLGSAVTSAAEGSEFVVTAIPAARPGSLSTWAVDRVRAIPWIGSEGLQWLKGTFYDLQGKLEDASEKIAATDPQAKIAEEIGDVWTRLPVLEESAAPDWPPAPLTPKLREPLPGEGQWVDVTHEPAFSALSSPSMLFTFIRVDPKRAHNQVSIALWDPRRIELHVVAGTEEPKSTLGNRGRGLIPRDEDNVGRLVAAFNGAFQAVHGEFGMMDDGLLLLPPKPFAATVATDREGRASLGTWPADPVPLPVGMRAFRQNMTPLVAEGRVNPYQRHWWGGVPEGWKDESRTVRSALCRTKQGHLAYFYSPSIDPDRLAEALERSNCDYGIHLDMNGGHAGFELYRVGRTDTLPHVTRPLDPMWEARGPVGGLDGYSFNARLLVRHMPLMNFPRYIHLTPRDFFYLTERPVLPGPPLTSTDSCPAGEWRPVSEGNAAYPPALVSATVGKDTEPSEVIRIDPRLLTAATEPNQKALVSASGANSERRTLSFHGGKFSIAEEVAPDALALASEEPRGVGLACVDPEGFLNVAPRGLRSSCKLELLTGCETVLELGRSALTFVPDQSDPSRTVLTRAQSFSAGRLFPETPIVPPTKWGIPQSKRPELPPER